MLVFLPVVLILALLENFVLLVEKTKTRKVDDLYSDVPYENSVHNCLKADENIDANGSKEARMKLSKMQKLEKRLMKRR